MIVGYGSGGNKRLVCLRAIRLQVDPRRAGGLAEARARGLNVAQEYSDKRGNIVKNTHKWPRAAKRSNRELVFTDKSAVGALCACPSRAGRGRRCVLPVPVCVCEAVGEVRGCEGEGYPTASKRRGGLSCMLGVKKEMKNG